MVLVPIKNIFWPEILLDGIFLFPMFPTAKAVKGGFLTRVALLIPFFFHHRPGTVYP